MKAAIAARATAAATLSLVIAGSPRADIVQVETAAALPPLNVRACYDERPASGLRLPGIGAARLTQLDEKSPGWQLDIRRNRLDPGPDASDCVS